MQKLIDRLEHEIDVRNDAMKRLGQEVLNMRKMSQAVKDETNSLKSQIGLYNDRGILEARQVFEVTRERLIVAHGMINCWLRVPRAVPWLSWLVGARALLCWRMPRVGVEPPNPLKCCLYLFVCLSVCGCVRVRVCVSGCARVCARVCVSLSLTLHADWQHRTRPLPAVTLLQQYRLYSQRNKENLERIQRLQNHLIKKNENELQIARPV